MNLRAEFSAPAPAIVLAEGAFGATGGKTANGVVMHSELFDAVAVVDSETAGRRVSEVLTTDDVDDVPIVATMDEALERAPEADALVIGVAPAGGQLPDAWVDDIRMAMAHGCDVVSGLHTFLSEDPEWQRLEDAHDVTIHDVRKPPTDGDLSVGDGSVDDVDAPVVLTMGTDCAVGKRTTTFELYRAARRRGIDAGWVGTGQTGIMVGAHRGVVIDRVPADFTTGTVEALVVDVASDHDLVFVEGQASLSHRAYSGVTLSILHGAWPDSVVLADEPKRRNRTHFEQFPVAGVTHETEAIEHLAEANVVAISTWGDPEEATSKHGIPAGNVLNDGGADRILDAVLESIDVSDGRPSTGEAEV